jgi:hypothetical protein
MSGSCLRWVWFMVSRSSPFVRRARKFVTFEVNVRPVFGLYGSLWNVSERDFNLGLQLFFHTAAALSGPGSPHYRGFTITLRHTTLGRTPLDEWSVLRRDLYLITHNTHNRHTSMPPAGLEPEIPASERPQTHALDRAGHWEGRRPLIANQNLNLFTNFGD